MHSNLCQLGIMGLRRRTVYRCQQDDDRASMVRRSYQFGHSSLTAWMRKLHTTPTSKLGANDISRYGNFKCHSGRRLVWQPCSSWDSCRLMEPIMTPCTDYRQDHWLWYRKDRGLSQCLSQSVYPQYALRLMLIPNLRFNHRCGGLRMYGPLTHRSALQVEVPADTEPAGLQTPFVYWPMIESGVGIIGACLPLMRPLISGATSRGFMRNLRSYNGTTSDNSGTFWEHDDNTVLRDEWNNSVASTKFGSASQASTKQGGSISTMKWGTESLPPVDPHYH